MVTTPDAIRVLVAAFQLASPAVLTTIAASRGDLEHRLSGSRCRYLFAAIHIDRYGTGATRTGMRRMTAFVAFPFTVISATAV
jgi:hypothetical protein